MSDILIFNDYGTFFGIIGINFTIKMKKIIWTTILLITLVFQELSSQVKQWTLEDCINYAVENNIDLQRQKLLTKKVQRLIC